MIGKILIGIGVFFGIMLLIPVVRTVTNGIRSAFDEDDRRDRRVRRAEKAIKEAEKTLSANKGGLAAARARYWEATQTLLRDKPGAVSLDTLMMIMLEGKLYYKDPARHCDLVAIEMPEYRDPRAALQLCREMAEENQKTYACLQYIMYLTDDEAERERVIRRLLASRDKQAALYVKSRGLLDYYCPTEVEKLRLYDDLFVNDWYIGAWERGRDWLKGATEEMIVATASPAEKWRDAHYPKSPLRMAKLYFKELQMNEPELCAKFVQMRKQHQQERREKLEAEREKLKKEWRAFRIEQALFMQNEVGLSASTKSPH